MLFYARGGVATAGQHLGPDRRAESPYLEGTTSGGER